MSRLKAVKPDEDYIEEVEDDQEQKNPKAIRFFSDFNNADYDYVVSLYRKDGRGKRVFIKNFDNEVPDLNYIQEKFGGGDYTMYANKYENGKSAGQLDSVTFNIAPVIPEQISGSKPDDFFSMDNLQKLATIKTIFGGDGGNNNMSDVLLRMTEMMNQSTLKMMELQRESDRRTAELINNFNEKTTNMVMQIKDSKSSLSEMAEMFEFFNSISGGSAGEKSVTDRLLDLAPAILGGATSLLHPKTVNPEVKNITPTPKTRTEEISEIVDKLPIELKSKVTQQTKGDIIKSLYESYKTTGVSLDDITDVVNEIIRRQTNVE